MPRLTKMRKERDDPGKAQKERGSANEPIVYLLYRKFSEPTLKNAKDVERLPCLGGGVRSERLHGGMGALPAEEGA